MGSTNIEFLNVFNMLKKMVISIKQFLQNFADVFTLQLIWNLKCGKKNVHLQFYSLNLYSSISQQFIWEIQ